MSTYTLLLKINSSVPTFNLNLPGVGLLFLHLMQLLEMEWMSSRVDVSRGSPAALVNSLVRADTDGFPNVLWIERNFFAVYMT